MTTHGYPTVGKRVVIVVDDREPGLGYLGRRERVAHRRLVAGRRHRRGRVVGEAQTLARGRGDEDALVVDRHDRVDGGSCVERDDHVGGGFGIAEGYHDRPVSHVVRQRLLLLGSDDDLDAQPGGRLQEVRCPVRRGGEQEEDARHPPIMVGMSELLTITEEARAKVLEARAAEADADGLALWVEVDGEQSGAYTYLMEFRPTSELGDDVVIQHHDDLPVAIPADSVERLDGATLAFNGGMVMQNPNRPVPASPAMLDRPPADLSGEVPQRVIQVLEEQINPAIASHGGHAELVAVEDSVAYLRLSGGCQGCGMAAVTLSQGIEVAILDMVPEITEVIDVTDHASGANPFYEAAKK